ncbi:MAG: monovalent cation/H(+) antiporter subunit G [Caulobacteraceae bacterium]|nr:monovalent cation/H(+) antiporter subunit G [Caulobacteraceae bacterium]MBK8544426.1 monovalent cation/H(+) antiporter subunit G [Caulobacteraceae bacterium]
MDVSAVLELVRLGLSGIVVAIGLLLIAGGALGLLRFPDLYTRLHAANVADVVGSVGVVLGLAIAAPDWNIALRLLLLAALLIALGPTLTHLVAQAAHAAGLAPIAGRYAAPRPGATRSSTPQ